MGGASPMVACLVRDACAADRLLKQQPQVMAGSLHNPLTKALTHHTIYQLENFLDALYSL